MLKKNRKDLNLWKWNWAKISAFFMSHFHPSSLLLYFQTLNYHLLKKGRMRPIFRFTWTFLCIWILCFLNKIWESNCETSWLIAFGIYLTSWKVIKWVGLTFSITNSSINWHVTMEKKTTKNQGMPRVVSNTTREEWNRFSSGALSLDNTLTLNLQSPELCKNKFVVLSHPVVAIALGNKYRLLMNKSI